jgi:hypothetical protein
MKRFKQFDRRIKVSDNKYKKSIVSASEGNIKSAVVSREEGHENI